MPGTIAVIRSSFFRLVSLTFCCALLWPISAVFADFDGVIVFTQRFDDFTQNADTPSTIVNEVEWNYVRAPPSLSFTNKRVIWTGAGAMLDANDPQSRIAGSDGLFYRPDDNLLVGNWQASQLWVFDPTGTDVEIAGGDDAAFPFHLLLHPNENDFLATPALSEGPSCGCDSQGMNCTLGCFGVYKHTPLSATTHICLAPPESASGDNLQPVTFIADENLNMFVLFTSAASVQFGGAGFASFNLDTTDSTSCSNNMSMTELIPPDIEEAHSVSWDPFLSDANNKDDPHSDFIVFANSRLAHIRVDDPGTPGATARVVASIDMATETVCDPLLPDQVNAHEFDQGAVNGEGIAMVGDESNGYLALVDYSQNTNGTILDGARTVCLTEFLHDGIDDIAPLTGLGAKSFFGSGGDGIFEDSFEN